MKSTHTVTNQVPPLKRLNAFHDDLALQEGLKYSKGQWAIESVELYGAKADDMAHWGELANHYEPTLHTHDRYGFRMDSVEFHESYHQLMHRAQTASLHSLPWQRPQLGSHAARLALEYLHIQAEAGTACPISMTFAGIPLLEKNDYLRQHWLPKALEPIYDPHNRPATDKNGLTLGMAMTEKQGGSDVRANQTQAVSQDQDHYLLTGHKWFCSAPMCDGFFVTAQASAGLTCFLVPRWRLDQSKNTMHLMRLKDKVGNRSNASSEVEFDQAFAWRIGEEGEGIKTILNMVSLTRFDCMVGSTALMRQAWVQAFHHARHRKAFGQRLIEQPLMANVLADAAIEIESHLAFCFELATLLDDASEQALLKVRLLTALGKYWICKRAASVIVEMMECLGGAGYVEDFPLARLYREAPLNAIWEGCGNIQCLDIMRMLRKAPQLCEALILELEESLSATELSSQLNDLKGLLRSPEEVMARRICEQLARLYQAHVLVKVAPDYVSKAYLSKMLDHSLMLGANKLEAKPILERAWQD